MSKLKLYNVCDDYINYLRQFDNKVFSNKEENRIHERKYLGVVLEINSFNYFVPLSSPKKSDYIYNGDVAQIRKNTVPIMRITDNNNGIVELKGTLKFSNMIPIPQIALINYNINGENDLNYKILIEKEYRFIIVHSDKIIKNANVIYNQKINNYDIRYLSDTVDFKLLEDKCLMYKNNN